jgi:hypothetical protein
MKRYSPLSLLWLTASPLVAADLSPSSLIPHEATLGRPGAALEKTGDISLGLRFEQAKTFRLSPQSEDTSQASFIQRELQIAARVASRLDLGLALRTSQESLPDLESQVYGQASHKNKPLTTGAWLSWHLLDRPDFRTSLSLQYLAGQGSPFAFHQASQDRSVIGLSQEWMPSSWFQGAVYVLGARRQDEQYRQSFKLGQELVWGTRLSLGPGILHLSADAEARQIEVKTEEEAGTTRDKTQGRLLRLGLGSRIQNWDMRVTTMIPTKERYLGVPERNIVFSLSYRFGSSSSAEGQGILPEPTRTEEDQTNQDSAPQANAQDAEKAPNQLLEENELDEFQILEKKLSDEAQNPQESPQEIAERELRSLRDAEKVAESEALQAAERERAQAYERIKRELEAEDQLYNEYRLDVEDEVEQFALPDSEELNWKGLQE